MPKEPELKEITDEKLLYRIKQFQKDIANLLGTKPVGTLIHVLLENEREMLLQSETPDLATSCRRYYMTAATLLRKLRNIYDDDYVFSRDLCTIIEIVCDHDITFTAKMNDKMSQYPATPISELPKDRNELN